MKKLLVFGAAGGTGIEITKQALQLGHIVTAVVRDPEAFTLAHPYLTVRKGDVTLAATFEDLLTGQDIVISAIGCRSTQPTTLYSTGLRNIVDVMARSKVSRLVCISAGGLDVNPKAGFFVRLLTRYVLQRILREPYADLRRMEAIVRESPTDYTIIRPSRLLDKPLTGHYRAAINDDLVRPFSIARADVAHYIVNHLEDAKTSRSIVPLSY